MNGRMRIQVVVDEEEIIRRRLPDQGAGITRRAAHPEHPQFEQRPHAVERREVIREGRDAQNLGRARSGIENACRDVPIGGGESSCLHQRGAEADDR